MSPVPKQWSPSPRGQYVASAIGLIGFIVCVVLFVHQPGWLPGLAAALMLLAAVTSLCPFALVERFVCEARIAVPPPTIDHEEAP